MRGAITVVLLGLTACGRTELVRYSFDRPDASIDSGVDAGRDAGLPDAGRDAGIEDAGCFPRPLPIEPALPLAMFVIDRSGSMDEDLDGRPDAGQGASRWDVLERSLASVLPPLDQQIAMGVMMYPVPGSSCSVAGQVDLSPARGNAARLLDLFRTTQPLGGTPTSEVLQVASQHVLGLPAATSARAMILATDGAPNCNTFLNNDTCTCTSTPVFDPNCDAPTHCLDDRRTINTISALFQNNRLPTYVIGLGSQLSAWRSSLDQMAIAGGVPRMGAGTRYYSITNQAELTTRSDRITQQLTRCTYLVSGAGVNELLTVTVAGTPIFEGPGGWEWLDQQRGELVLRGMPCDTAAMGAVVEVVVACAP